MFFYSVKTTPRGLGLALGCLLLAFTLIGASFLLPEQAVETAVRAESVEDQLLYLRSLGYTAEPNPLSIEEVQIPDTPDDTFLSYNALQKEAGFDLSGYGGNRVKCFCFAVTNDKGDAFTAHLYIWRGKLIGGHLSSSEQPSVLHPLQKCDVQED